MASRIALRPRVMALLAQKAAAVALRTDKRLSFATRPVAALENLTVPTRHGPVRCRIHRPHPDAPLGGGAPPVHLQIHGGAFFVRTPRQDDHINSYLASDVGAVVLNPDYDVAPQVQYPVAEQQCVDVATWVHRHGAEQGWDTARISVGGTSAGGKFAVNVAQQVHESGEFGLRALALVGALVDMTRADRTSSRSDAMIGAGAQRLMLDTYFADDSRRREPLASPALDPDLAKAVPPTLIMTGGLDTLAPEMDLLAEQLAAAGVDVNHRRYPDADHGFSHFPPVETARDAIELLGGFLLQHLR